MNNAAFDALIGKVYVAKVKENLDMTAVRTRWSCLICTGFLGIFSCKLPVKELSLQLIIKKINGGHRKKTWKPTPYQTPFKEQ